jgi:glycosyltransferase involved in cell wall biosynthesis
MQQRCELLQNKNLSISCVIPCFNEEAVINIFLLELVNQLQEITSNFQLILIDDGSSDQTVEQILNFKKSHYQFCHGIKLIQLSRNFGKEIALFAGIEYISNDLNNAVTILIDADLQHPITLIPTMLQYWANGFDMVYGIRNNRNDETWLKRMLTKWFYRLMHCITKINIISNAGDFRLLDQKVVTALAKCKEYNRFTKGLYAWVGFNSYGIEFKANKRKIGKSTFGLKTLANLAITGIISFSDIPLRIWSLLGLVISSMAFIYALFMIIKTTIYGIDVPGYLSLMIAIIFFGGIQLLSVGILGEYIARIFNEVKQRPRYIIKNIF